MRKMESIYSAIRITTTTVADLRGPGGDLYIEEEKPFEEYLKRGGPLQLLEAVYCDPCKAKVGF